MKFGIEIEAKGMTLQQVDDLLNSNGIECSAESYNRHVRGCWFVVPDGSLGSGGFELISPPLEFNPENLALVKRVANLLNDAGCGVDRKCGLHVHFEVSGFSAQHVANVYNRYRKFENEIDQLMPASRRASNNRYCQTITRYREMSVLSTTAETISNHAMQACTRYLKVNLQSFVKYGTIEFRQHSGTVNGTKLVNWIQLLAQFIEASRPIVVEQPTAAQPATAQLKGNAKAIVDLLRTDEYRYGATAERIAFLVGSTPASVQSTICRLRANASAGIQITRGHGRGTYRLCAQQAAQPTYQPLNPYDSLWRGIDSTLVQYYARRSEVLSTEQAA